MAARIWNQRQGRDLRVSRRIYACCGCHGEALHRRLRGELAIRAPGIALFVRCAGLPKRSRVAPGAYTAGGRVLPLPLRGPFQGVRPGSCPRVRTLLPIWVGPGFASPGVPEQTGRHTSPVSVRYLRRTSRETVDSRPQMFGSILSIPMTVKGPAAGTAKCHDKSVRLSRG
jgi:hypothetical protein